MGFMSGVGVEHCRETVGHLWYPHVAERGRRPKKNGRGRMWRSEREGNIQAIYPHTESVTSSTFHPMDAGGMSGQDDPKMEACTSSYGRETTYGEKWSIAHI